MTKRQREAVTALLRELADRMTARPKIAAENAERMATADKIPRFRESYVVSYRLGELEAFCEFTAIELRSIIDVYLPAKSGKRGRR